MNLQTKGADCCYTLRWRHLLYPILVMSVAAFALLFAQPAAAKSDATNVTKSERMKLALSIYVDPHSRDRRGWRDRDRWRDGNRWRGRDGWRGRHWRDRGRGTIRLGVPPRHGWSGSHRSVRVFYNPRYRGHRLDWCYRFGSQCGIRAAHAYCRMKGFKRAVAYRVAHDIGPTRIIGTSRVCPHGWCDGYSWVRCASGSRVTRY